MRPRSDPPDKPTYHHGDLPSALIHEAVKLIRARGDMNFSLRELGSRLGVSHSAVYRHYRDKSALLNAVAVRGFALLTQAVCEAGAGLDNNPNEQLARQGCAYVAMAMRHPAHFAVMFPAQSSPASQAPEVRAAALEAYQLMVATVMRRQRESDISNPSVQQEAIRCWALVHGLASLQISGNLEAYLAPDRRTAPAAEVRALVVQLLTPVRRNKGGA